MTTIQAVELEQLVDAHRDHGCVVVTPEGEICQLDLTVIAGAEGVSHVDHVEEFHELDLSLAEYIAYARAGVAALTEELSRRQE